MVTDLFLNEEELKYLTGISKGRNGKSKHELQRDQLLVMRVPFRVNARGAPVVTHAAVVGPSTQDEVQSTPWKSNALKKA